MKIRYLKLINYIGIYNGLGLKEIVIDFSNCKHRVTMIKGNNGSGKSTLFKALHPLPDNNSDLIPGEYAEKNIVITHNESIYNILIKHEIKDNGTRGTTKAYMEKNVNDTIDQLNPNGNVTSFKDLLVSEFSLDPNFVSLSQLSGDDRGLADKKPAERKKFVSSIINTLEVYNSIHKTLTKRSSIFKSMVNSITSKINNLGDREKLNLTLVSLENRLNVLITNKNSYIEEVARFDSKIKLLDPDGLIQCNYDTIYDELRIINNHLTTVTDKINLTLTTLSLEDTGVDTVISKYTAFKENVIKLEASLNYKDVKITTLLNRREEESNTLQNKASKLQELQNATNIDSLNESIEQCKNNITIYNNILSNDIGLTNINNISRDEFIMGLNTIKDIKESIDTFKGEMDYTITQQAIEFIKSNTYPDITDIDSRLVYIDESMYDLSNKLNTYKGYKPIIDNINNRPSSCNNDSCNFIKEGIDLKNSLGDINELIRIVENDMFNYEEDRLSLNTLRITYSDIIRSINLLKSLSRDISKSSLILNKLPINNIFSDKFIIFDLILNGYDFKELDSLYQFIGQANIIDEYKSELDRHNSLVITLDSYTNSIVTINDLIDETINLNNLITRISTNIEQERAEIHEERVKITTFKNIIIELDILIKLYKDKEDYLSNKHNLITRFNTIKASITEIRNCVDYMNIANNKLREVDNSIVPILNDRDKIKHSLSLLDEYDSELEVYLAKYNKAEIIKKYSSPNKGIQTIYMSLYMDKTITMANELLVLLFEGEYELYKYEINETEFRIPCKNNGIPNDDISSMSTSQVCMISMILSFVLLHQASTKYNIIKLDEIDGGLDTTNRLQFSFVLDKLMDLLEVEQCVMISHNNEMNTSNCDIIQLKTNDILNEGNFIYKY